MEIEAATDNLLKCCLSLPFTHHKSLPYCPAVYLLYVSPDIILYVGKTISLRNRAKQHFSNLKRVINMSVAWFPLLVEFHADTEKQLI